MKSLRILVIGGLLALGSGAATAAGDATAGAKVAETCAQCHGKDGNSQAPTFPRLAGQYADYIARALMDYKSGARQNPIMMPFASQLSEQDVKDVAAFFAGQPAKLYTPGYAD